jgi:hypothetical protein
MQIETKATEESLIEVDTKNQFNTNADKTDRVF